MERRLFLQFFAFALATSAFAQTPSARSPEVLASYSQAPAFSKQLASVEPRARELCLSLLTAQLELQKTTDSWKMYSLYQTFTELQLLESPIVRVPTVVELADAIPKYTAYRESATFKDGSIVVFDKGQQCGPDPLSQIKGAYFVKCGAFFIGSGLTEKLPACPNPRVLTSLDR